MNLSPRLRMAADMIRPGVVAADIGTDHAYLPVYLLLSGICPRVLACDAGEKPLDNAKQTAACYAVQGKLQLRLSDGLDQIAPQEADDFLFAGMGGTLITRLLARTLWIYDTQKRFIFQPMSRAEELRRFLTQQHFQILEERACTDNGFIYIALCAQYNGEKKDYPPGYAYYGELPRSNMPEAQEYIKKQLYRVQKRADALEKAERLPKESAALQLAAADIVKQMNTSPRKKPDGKTGLI